MVFIFSYLHVHVFILELDKALRKIFYDPVLSQDRSFINITGCHPNVMTYKFRDIIFDVAIHG